MSNGFKINQQEVGYSETHDLWRFDFVITLEAVSFTIPIFVEMVVPEEDRWDKARELFKNFCAAFASDVSRF